MAKRFLAACLAIVMLTGSLGPATRPAVVGATADPSGAALPLGDLPGWQQVFAEDFAQDSPLGAWPGPYGERFGAYAAPDTAARIEGTASVWDAARTVSVGDGLLDYALHTADGIGLSATVYPRHTSQLYGRFVVRMRADPVPGYKTAFLLWPESEDWPHDGEIDFPEGDLPGTVGGATHYQDGTSGADADVFGDVGTYADWHTYEIVWTPLALAYLIDGAVVHVTTTRIPDTPMQWALQSEHCLGGCAAPPAATGHLQIDWLAVYRYAP